MKKLLLGILVGMSLAFSAEVNEDLLSVATAGKVKGDTLYSSIYSNAFKTYYYHGISSWSSLIRVNR